MINLFCPKCYKNLSLSDWESDSKDNIYRCSKACCEIEFSESQCLSYEFDLPKSSYSLIGANKIKYDLGNIMFIWDVNKQKSIIEVKHFIPIDFNKTLPSQVENISQRLMKLVIFK